jgi:hypothetical protein
MRCFAVLLALLAAEAAQSAEKPVYARFNEAWIQSGDN